MGTSPYKIENKRAQLAAKGKLQELKKLYSKKYPEIKDLNSAKFWNDKLKKRKPISEQDGMTRDRVKMAAEYLSDETLAGKTILDIGMGDGWVEEFLEHKDVEFYGNDISDVAIKNAKKRFKGKFTVQSIYDLKYKRSFDAIFLLEVLEHIPPSKTFSVLKSIRKLLSPEGYFILSIPTNEGLETMSDNPSGHVRMYTIPLITAELELAGFTVLKVKTLTAFKKFYPLKKMLAKILKNHWHPNDIVVLAQKNLNLTSQLS